MGLRRPEGSQLKEAARSIRADGAPKEDRGLDFPGFGPHSLRRANITWRQEVGGSSIETSKIAGHASTAITEEYHARGTESSGRPDAPHPGEAGQGRAQGKAVASQTPVSDELAAQRERAKTARTGRKDRKDQAGGRMTPEQNRQVGLFGTDAVGQAGNR